MAYHRFDARAANQLLRRPVGGVARDMWARGLRVANLQRQLVGRTSEDLARDVHPQWIRGPLYPGVEVGSDLPQAIHHFRGHRVIRPVRAKVLAFRPKGSPTVIFRMRVGPVRGNPWLTRSLRAVRR